MLRSLVVIVSALAISAQAQEASTPEEEEKPAPNAPGPAMEGEQGQTVLASIEPQLTPSAPTARLDAGIEAEARAEPIDCGMQDSMLSDEDPPVAVGTYNPKTPKDRPAVWRAGRCLRKCMLQVQSQSKEPWVIKNARVEGPGGEVLKVTGIRSRPGAEQTISVIEAERTNGPALTSKMKLTLHLVAEDGRVALLQEELP